MSNLTVEYPDRLVGGVQSNINADLSQIPIKVLMDDDSYLVSDNQIGDGIMVSTSDLNTIFDEYVIGDSIYIDFDESAPFKAGVFIVDAVSIMAGGTRLGLSTPAGTYGTVGTFRVYHNSVRPIEIEIDVLDSDDTLTGGSLIPSPIPYSLDSTGQCFIDLSGVMYGLLEANRYTNYQITITILSDDLGFAITGNFSSSIITGLPASIQQLGDIGGSNMAFYLLETQTDTGADNWDVLNVSDEAGDARLNLTPDNIPFTLINQNRLVEVNASPYIGIYSVVSVFDSPSNKYIVLDTSYISDLNNNLTPNTVSNYAGQWLTETRNLYAWKGWKRFASVCIDSDFTNRTPTSLLKFYSKPLDVNKVELTTTPLIHTGDLTPRVHDVKVLEPNYGVTPTAYYTKVYSEDDTTNTIAKPLLFEWLDDCPNGIMLDWLNRTGGFEQHLFTVNQVVKNEVDAGIIYETQINDTLDRASSTINRSVNKKSQFITLRAEKLSLEYYKSLTSLVESSVVNMWRDKEGVNKVGVIVQNGLTQTHQTKDNSLDFTVTIQLPPNYNAFK